MYLIWTKRRWGAYIKIKIKSKASGEEILVRYGTVPVRQFLLAPFSLWYSIRGPLLHILYILVKLMQKITNKEGLPSPSLTTTHSTTHVRKVLVVEYGPSLSLFYSDWGGIINKYITNKAVRTNNSKNNNLLLLLFIKK